MTQLELNIKEAHIKFCEESNIDLQPLAIVRLCLKGKVSNWTKNLHVKAKIELEATYYNHQISNWEPLIEPVLVCEDVYRPWSISLWFAIEQGGILQPPINSNGVQFIEFPVKDLDYSVLENQITLENELENEAVSLNEADMPYQSQSSIIDMISISREKKVKKEKEPISSTASFINIESNDLLSLNVTPTAYKVIMYLAQITASSSETEILENKSKKPFKLLNFLGESATLVVLPVSILRPEYVIGFDFKVKTEDQLDQQDVESLYHSTESINQISQVNTVKLQVDANSDEKYKFYIHIDGFEKVKLSLKTDGAYLIQLRETINTDTERRIEAYHKKTLDMIKYNIMFRIRTNYGRAKVIFR